MLGARNFSRSELECKCGCGTCYIQKRALRKLQFMRDLLGAPLIINSACRCPRHNAKVGGVPNSTHRSTWWRPSSAFDISLKTHKDREKVVYAAKAAGFKGIGIYKKFIHVDDRDYIARW